MASRPPDYYDVLGVEERADAKAIKTAFRELARQYHPDKNPDDPKAEARFKEVQEAYETLSDPTKRKQYDRMRKNPGMFGGPGGMPSGGGFGGGFRPGGVGPDDFTTGAGGRFFRKPDGTYVRVDSPGTAPGGAGGGGIDDMFGGGAFGDLFGGMFGGQQGAPGPRRQAKPKRGRDIDTTLKLSFQQALDGGKTEVTTPQGKTVRISLPKGVDSGFKIRLKGQGELAPMGGPRGHLFVTVEVAPDARFAREGLHVTTPVEISAFDAMRGTSARVTTPYGKTLRVTLPPGTQPGHRLRLRAQGIQTDDANGDLFAEVIVTIPPATTDAQRAALDAAEEALGDDES